MVNRRHAVLFAAIAAVLSVIMLRAGSPANAEQSFQRFFPFLVDLQGWQGKKADGMAMEMAGSSMVTATREYQRGEARLTAAVVTGPVAQGALAAAKSGLKIETSEGRMGTSTVDGMLVMRTFTVRDKSGAIIVGLGASAMFSLTFHGVDDEEALGLARKFDWKAIQAATAK